MSLILSGTDGLSDVDGTAATPAIRGTDANTGIFFPAADTIAFSEGGAEAARFNSSGNLLLGNSSSYAGKFQSWGAVTANAATPNISAIDTTSVASGVGGELAFIGQYTAGDYAYMGSIRGIKENGTDNNTACALTFYTRPTGTAPSEKMRLDSSGNLLVGGTSNAAGARLLSENASGNQLGLRYTSVATWYNSIDSSGNYIWTKDGSEKARIDSSGNLGIGTTSTTAVRLIAKGSTSNGTSNAFKLIDSADADILAMSTAGDFYLPKMGSSTGTTVVLTSGNYLVKSSSSIRYKKDVEPIDIGLNFVLGLNPVKYKMKLDDANQVGFIAEDFPDERLVSFSLVNPQDKQSELQRESVNYANLVAPLVKAIQEQQALITQLTARITALEGA